MDAPHDQPKMGVNLDRKTTQLNLWMVVGILAFLIIAGVVIFRLLRNPPDSTQEMQRRSSMHVLIYSAGAC